MHTLNVLVASLMTVSFNNAPDNRGQSYGYYPPNQSSMVMLAAAGEPIAPQELELPHATEESYTQVDKEPYALMKGECYYMSTCDPCQCRRPGLHLGAELTFLKPYGGNPCIDPPCFPEDAIQAVEQLEPEFDFYGAPRLWLGYTCCNGLGFRVRWWQFDQNASEDVSFLDQNQNSFTGTVGASYDVNTLDFEITDALIVGRKWDLMLSGGIRYAKFRRAQLSDGSLDFFSTEGGAQHLGGDTFEGAGATAALELHRNVFRRIGVFTNIRGSLLYGDAEVFSLWESDESISNFIPDSQAGKIVGVVRSVWEAQLGVDWTHEMWQGVYLTGRVAGEVQYWDSMVANTDVGFAGLTFAVGLIR
jgi:hypothetical protein